MIGLYRTVMLAVTLTVLVGLHHPTAAEAQSWTRPSAVDYDSPEEATSELWEQVLLGGDNTYVERMAEARALSKSRSLQNRAAAVPIFEALAKEYPTRAEIHSELGMVYQRQKNWAGCAQALQHVYQLDPDYDEKGLSPLGTLDMRLATCLLYSEQYEGAITHLQHLIAQNQESITAQLRLGEAYMALGRLEEATFAFQRAYEMANRSRSRYREAGYGLAVALDRAERVSESKDVLTHVVRGDSRLTTLLSSDKTFAPVQDEHYYLGLAYQQQRNTSRAIYHFRRFLSLDPKSPWRIHARSHLESLGTPALATLLSVNGSAQWPLEPLRNAIRASETSLRVCVANHPLVLAELKISEVNSKPSSGVQATASIQASDEKDKQVLDGILDCLESAARKIRVPKQSGLRGGYGNAEFTILGSPTP